MQKAIEQMASMLLEETDMAKIAEWKARIAEAQAIRDSLSGHTDIPW